jgi:hypothetical protein
MPVLDRITRDTQLMGGKPCIRCTRAKVRADRISGPGAAPEKSGSWVREHAQLAEALILMRDGEPAQREKRKTWAMRVFEQTLEATRVLRAHEFPPGLRFNPVAMAFAGVAHALRDGLDAEGVRRLLEVAGRDVAELESRLTELRRAELRLTRLQFCASTLLALELRVGGARGRPRGGVSGSP